MSLTVLQGPDFGCGADDAILVPVLKDLLSGKKVSSVPLFGEHSSELALVARQCGRSPKYCGRWVTPS